MKKMFRIVLSLIILLMTIGTVNAINTIPSEQWNYTFGGKNQEYVVQGQQTLDGGFALIGGTFDSGGWLIKTDFKGKEQWNKNFEKNSTFNSGQQTKDGGYILGGRIDKDGLLIKTDSDGNKIWDIIFKKGDWEYRVNVFSARQTLDGGYIIGLSKLIGAAYWNISIIKLDYNKKQIWTKYLGNYYRARIDDIQQTNDGGYIILGDSYYHDSYLKKLDFMGNELWNKTIRKVNALSIDQTRDGGFILGGYEYYGQGVLVWIGKISKNGDMQWNKTLSKGIINSVKTISEGYILAGNNNNGDGLVINTNSNGNEIWNMTIGGTGSDNINSVQQTSDGYILAGTTNSYGAGNYDAWLVKLSLYDKIS